MSEPQLNQRVEFRAQEGPQEEFLSSIADIVFYGGAAGGGKTFGLLLEPLRHLENKQFGAVIFRRNSTQVRNEGGLWDESEKIYPHFGANPKEAALKWVFPAGWSLKFSHLEYDKTVLDWQGAQIPYIGFDEITHFTEKQFFYMMSRNRSTSGVPGYIRATCNPDADSWVRILIAWWIGPDGLPIKSRSGVVRWFIRSNDTIIWGDSREELIKKYGAEELPKSFTFIAADVYDNKILMEKDPAYLANLKALPRIDRLRLLGGNWDVRPAAGMYFQREWFTIIDAMPANVLSQIRYWDRAATLPNEDNKNPDWTAGSRIARLTDGRFVIMHIARLRDRPLNVERFVKNTATQDTSKVPVGIEQDPGSAGVADAQNFARLLAGFDVRIRKPTQDKATRARPLSAQCEAGNVLILRGAWNEEFFKEAENFTGEDGQNKDDQIDACSGAFNELCGSVSTFDVM